MRKKEKIIEIPASVVNRLQQDIKENGVIIYAHDKVPKSFINKNLIHPEVAEKCNLFYAAVSGSTPDNRAYMFLAPSRVDHERRGAVTDVDPIVFVSDLDSGAPAPSGIVTFHSEYEGRTEPLDIEASEVNMTELRGEVTTEIIPFDKAPERLKNAMHYVADKYKKKFDNK